MLKQPSGSSAPDPRVHQLRTRVTEARKHLELLLQQFATLETDLDRSATNVAGSAVPGSRVLSAAIGSASSLRSAPEQRASQDLLQLEQEVQRASMQLQTIRNAIRAKHDQARNSINNLRR